jgi:hypothetical protein
MRKNIIIALLAIHPLAFGHDASGSHGGDTIKLIFSKARLQAVNWVSKFDKKYLTDTWDGKAIEWLDKNKERLAEDIALSKHTWVEEETAMCAKTQTESKASIQLSVTTCKKDNSKPEDAAQILIHESTHHLGVDNEEFADLIAISVAWAWNHAGSGLDFNGPSGNQFKLEEVYEFTFQNNFSTDYDPDFRNGDHMGPELRSKILMNADIRCGDHALQVGTWQASRTCHNNSSQPERCLDLSHATVRISAVFQCPKQ